MTAVGAEAMGRVEEGHVGDGERREAAMRRRRALTIGALVLVGGFSGFYVGLNEARAFFDGGSFWTPGVSLVLSALFIAAMIGGSILLQSSMDEVERDRSYKAAAAAGASFLLLYPLWFLLWKGGFVPEPIHWMLFLVFWATLALASLWYRFR